MITPADGQALAQLLDERAEEVHPDDGVYTPTFIDSAEFALATYPRDWLVPGVLASGQPAVVGGPKKSLKTSIIVDLAISLAFGILTRFLDRFPVNLSRRLAVISGESGEATLQETARRVCESKGVRLRDAPISWGFVLPRLAILDDVAILVAALVERGIEVLILDPLYLCLLSGAPDLQAANLYHIGPLLRLICDACLRAGITPILVHHSRKLSGPQRGFPPPELDDLTFAGIAEFVRQWLLIGRRALYDPDSGEHKLWLSVGGSAGQSGLWGLDVREGLLRPDFGGRVWEPRVVSLDQIELQQRVARADAGGVRAQEAEEARRQSILTVMAGLRRPETMTEIGSIAKMNGKNVRAALEQLEDLGRVERVDFEKNQRPQKGWRLVGLASELATSANTTTEGDAGDE